MSSLISPKYSSSLFTIYPGPCDSSPVLGDAQVRSLPELRTKASACSRSTPGWDIVSSGLTKLTCQYYLWLYPFFAQLIDYIHSLSLSLRGFRSWFATARIRPNSNIAPRRQYLMSIHHHTVSSLCPTYLINGGVFFHLFTSCVLTFYTCLRETTIASARDNLPRRPHGTERTSSRGGYSHP